ncbi:MAG: neutral/alkaline non-lysosomal ceramidase N-terminal domain-containing protein [Armatimonadota bacterium]|nr:MAG: neutral/alkaline non-lysosomal ceramidase N-terminal domain-containing protein [Armatimonadota bacterium]
MSKLRAGAARVKITPLPGVDLSGYAFREGPSEGVHDDLWCRALILDDEISRLALVALDLLGVDFPLDAAIRKAVAQVADLPPDHVLVNCSHTHAGPAVSPRLTGLGLPNESYVHDLPDLASDAAAVAASKLAPATLSYGEAPLRVGINRRERTEDGHIKLGRFPEGPADDAIRIVRVDAGNEERAAVIFHHACHGTTLGSENRMISSEWMGVACERVATRLPSPTIPIFLQGCCGQINPDAGDSSFEEVARLGAEAGDAALVALDSAEQLRGTPLAVRLRRIELPQQDPPPPDQARAGLESAKKTLEAARQKGAHSYVLRAHETQVAYAGMVQDLAERDVQGHNLPFVVHAMQIGELAVLALSGEVFLEFARRIEAGSPFRHTLVLGYSNGCTGYVPTAEAFQEGGYEVEDSFRWYGTLPLSPGAGEIVAAAALETLRDLPGARSSA